MEGYAGISKYTKRPRQEKISSFGIKGIPHFSNFKNHSWKVSIMAKNIGGVANKGRSGKFVDYIRREAESLINIGDVDAKQRFSELDDKLLSKRKNSVIQRRLIIPVPTEFLKNKDALMEKLGKELQDKYFGACYTWTASLHAGDFKNPHIHVVFSNCDNDLKNIREFHDKDFLNNIKKDMAVFFNQELGLDCEVGLPKKKRELGIKAGAKHYPQWVIGTYQKYQNNPEKLKEYCEKYSILQDYIDNLKLAENLKTLDLLKRKENRIKQELKVFTESNNKVFKKIKGNDEKEFVRKVYETKNKIIKEAKANMDLEPIRNINIVELAESLGFQQDKYDKKAYRRSDIKVSIDEKTGKFNSFTNPNVKGIGAIDFVMANENKSFKDTIEFLAASYSIIERKTPFQQEKVKEREQLKVLEMPKHTEFTHNLQIVDYLTYKDRKISFETIKKLMEQGKIYQDNKGNAVFICKDVNGNITGAEIKSKNFKGMAKGTDRNAGAFCIFADNPKTLVITESAIDAISYYDLKKPENAAIISTGGVMPHSTKFSDDFIIKNKVENIKIGYDADEAGQKNAESLKVELEKKYPDVKIDIEKPIAKDWNDELKEKEIKQENQGFDRNKDKEQKLDDEFAQDLQRRSHKSKNISKGFGRS